MHSCSFPIHLTLSPANTAGCWFSRRCTRSTAAFDIALEQMKEVGWETLVLSFGSGFRYEMQPDDPCEPNRCSHLPLPTSAGPGVPAVACHPPPAAAMAVGSSVFHPCGVDIQTLKTNVAKATAMGIECGGYDLTVLDRGHEGYGGNVGDQWDRVAADGSFSADACYASGWRDKLETMLYHVTDTGESGSHSRLRCRAHAPTLPGSHAIGILLASVSSLPPFHPLVFPRIYLLPSRLYFPLPTFCLPPLHAIFHEVGVRFASL